jgi:hypothetical protein
MSDRATPIRTVLLVVIVVLLGQVAWQAWRIEALKEEVSYNRRHLEEQAGRLSTELLKGRRGDVVQATQWLHEFYASSEGLRRPGGLWLAPQNQPDFEAIGAWIFDVYLNARVNGASDESARQAIADAIKATDEWRRAHQDK